MRSPATIIIVSAMLLVGTGCGSSRYEYDAYYDGGSVDEHEYEYTVEEPEPYSGSTTVEACSQSSGNCYDLDADISDGEVETIYFPNGGYLELDDAELDEYGSGSGSTYDDEWEIQCDDCAWEH
ncbi:MAG: hypothetical protein Q7S96_04080 [bacterium]|nr:hypothetical protein [bacterium]